MNLKSFFSLFFVCAFLSPKLSAQMQNEKLTDVLQNKLFLLNKVGINGLGGKNIYLDLQSRSFDSLALKITPGMLFYPERSDFQTLMITQELEILFAPKEVKRIYLIAYCIHPSKMGPRAQANYKSWKMADPELQQLANMINDYPISNPQYAIWNFVNYAEITDLNLYKNDNASDKWQAFHQSNRPNTKLNITENDYKYKVYSPLTGEFESEIKEENVVSIASQFLFRNEEDLTLSLRVIDENNQIVRSYFEDKTYTKGAHSILIGFSDFYPKESVFRVQLLLPDGQIYQAMEVTEDTPFEEREIFEVNYKYQFTTREKLENMQIVLKTAEGELVSVLKSYEHLPVAYHNVQIKFHHYYNADQLFWLELIDQSGKVYDRTEFKAMQKGNKLYSEWK